MALRPGVAENPVSSRRKLDARHGQSPDLREAFRAGVALQTGAPSGHVAPNLWPAEPPSFASVWEAYFQRCDGLALEFMRLCAVALGLPLGWFDDKVSHPIANLMAQHYPALTAHHPSAHSATPF